MPYYKADINVNSLSEGELKACNANGKGFVVALVNGKINVLDGMCTHENGSLSEGYIDNDEVVCSSHSGAFKVETGQANYNTPWVTDITHYNLRINETTGDIEIEM